MHGPVYNLSCRSLESVAESCCSMQMKLMKIRAKMDCAHLEQY